MTKASIREREVEKHFNKRVAGVGGSVRKVKWIGRRSAPDRLALIPKWEYAFFAELKRPGLRATAQQSREHVRLMAAGLTVYTLTTIEAVDALFDKLEKVHSDLSSKKTSAADY